MGAGWRFPKGPPTVWGALERWLEAERGQLPLWFPVLFGAGITGWFVLADAWQWSGFIVAALGLATGGVVLPGRPGRVLLLAGLLLAMGCGAIWWRAESVRAPVLARPQVATFEAEVLRLESLTARGLVRLTLAPRARRDLPPRLRVNVDVGDMPEGLGPGARLALRARLVPPPGPSVPGAYDFRRVAWFEGLGATGKALGRVTVRRAPPTARQDLRAALSSHIESRLPGSAGGIASALATGDEGAIREEDSEAMRRAGLAHLLSVSGLHVTAVTGAAMLVVLRLLALSPWLALRIRLPLVAAGAGALAAIGYTWLTGGQVPTIRSCVAALLVLVALSLGREALTLRLVAAGAMVVLMLWPEALAGPSFQLSFTAVAAIVALHESPHMRRRFEAREEGLARRIAREAGSLLLTGILVELALTPIGLFHFHKGGVYGAVANIAAIPLTTFVVMPLEALALAADLVGAGAPFWWLTGKAMALLLWIAHTVASAPGSVGALPVMPASAFACMVVGGLWLGLWRTRARIAGLVPLLAGAAWALATPGPDLLVTGDGRHVALRMADGGFALLRDRAGDFTRQMLGENGGVEADALSPLAGRSDARCSPDLCVTDVLRAGRLWRIAATRSAYPVAWRELVTVCASSDVVISERRLPRACHPRWLRLDRTTLERTGGVSIDFGRGALRTVRGAGHHPWLDPPTVQPPFSAAKGDIR
ncbi:ComEC/Rec2 family competence protein [Sphingomonas sp. TDK1]|uniref:ComEC/Rec2 family competence protein n=1 Tax=Sphingomonas sp. TDK1 TaxID=453247 RepID=UPI0007D97952|nr:ComEC/Rec2 family competence protein [Sphingomonas sp. TDK1]OAN62796.1 competence protein ComEC [Sphingomonas sp. TDK1]